MLNNLIRAGYIPALLQKGIKMTTLSKLNNEIDDIGEIRVAMCNGDVNINLVQKYYGGGGKTHNLYKGLVKNGYVDFPNQKARVLYHKIQDQEFIVTISLDSKKILNIELFN